VVPLDATPVTFGDSSRTEQHEPVLIASASDAGASFAWVVSKRAFTGNWEYSLDSALYTSPPTLGWSGAALIDRNGKLIGIGSLIVREATEGDVKLPGNVFVPIDLLKPILADLVKEGHRSGPARPWLGINADEVRGKLLITRVSPDGPADVAGLQVGDVILSVKDDDVHSQTEFYEKLWNSSHAGEDVSLKVMQGGSVRSVNLRAIDRLEYFRPKTTI
jgi:serine protease Do